MRKIITLLIVLFLFFTEMNYAQNQFSLEGYFNTFYSNPKIESIEAFETVGNIKSNIGFGGGVSLHWRPIKNEEFTIKLGIAYNGTNFEFIGPGLDKNQDNQIDTVQTSTKFSAGSNDINAIISYTFDKHFGIEIGGIGAIKSVNDILKIVNLLSNIDTQTKLEDFNVFTGQVHLGAFYTNRLKESFSYKIGISVDLGTGSEGKTAFVDKIKNAKYGLNFGILWDWGGY